MARHASIARRYAEAAFQLANAPGQPADAPDRWRDELRLASGILADERVTEIVDSPARPWSEREDVLSGLLGSRVSPQTINLVKLLARRGRAGQLVAVTAEFERLLNASRGVVPATVTTARPLDEADLAAIRRRVETLAGAEVELTTNVDTALIGGVMVRIGDQLIDASVRGRLERLRTRLAVGAR